MKRLTSRQNPLVNRCRRIARGDERSVILLDGPHLVADGLEAGIDIQQVIVASAALDQPDLSATVRKAERSGIEVTIASASVMDAISPVRAPSRIVALASRPTYEKDRLYQRTRTIIVIACDVQDPGNVGAIVRVAEAAGASGLVAAGASADPFGWKALRGSMGSALRLPILVRPRIAEAAREAKGMGCRLVATVPRNGVDVYKADLTGPIALLIGGEGAGLPRELIDDADVRLTIPMAEPVESLNTAVTAALVLYEMRRQQ